MHRILKGKQKIKKIKINNNLGKTNPQLLQRKHPERRTHPRTRNPIQKRICPRQRPKARIIPLPKKRMRKI